MFGLEDLEVSVLQAPRLIFDKFLVFMDGLGYCRQWYCHNCKQWPNLGLKHTILRKNVSCECYFTSYFLFHSTKQTIKDTSLCTLKKNKKNNLWHIVYHFWNTPY